MKRFFLTSVIVLSTVAAGTPAIALPIVHEISQTQAQGLNGTGAQITVWSGSGTNIDFTRTGETIQKAWLDDPSRLTVDFDGNLCGGGNRGDCNASGASIIHLRRVTGIHFPNLPSTASTLLTVVTQSHQGRKIYLFEVTYGSGHSQYADVAITPDVQMADGIQIQGHRTANWNDIEQGLQRAVEQHLISEDSPIIVRVREFLAQVRNGTPMQQALQASGATLAVITHLAEMGYSSVFTTEAKS